MLYINSSVTCLKFAPNLSFSSFQPISAVICVTIATVKVESIPDFYTLAIVLKTNKKKLGKSNFYFLTSWGGGGVNGLLMHVPLLEVRKCYSMALMSTFEIP